MYCQFVRFRISHFYDKYFFQLVLRSNQSYQFLSYPYRTMHFVDNFVINGQWWHWHQDESMWPWRPTTRSTSHCSTLTRPLIASSRQTSASRLIATMSWSNNDDEPTSNTDGANHRRCTEIWKSISEVMDCVGRWAMQWRLRIAAAAAAAGAASGIDTVALRRRDWRQLTGIRCISPVAHFSLQPRGVPCCRYL